MGEWHLIWDPILHNNSWTWLPATILLFHGADCSEPLNDSCEPESSKIGENFSPLPLLLFFSDPDNWSQTESISVKNGSIIFVRIRELIPDRGLLGHFRQQVCGHNISNGMILITVLMNLFIKYFHGRPISQLIVIQGVEMSKSQMDQNKFPI